MRVIYPVFIIIFFGLPILVNAQHINDCHYAQIVCSDEDLAFNPQGPGFDDFADPDNHEGCIVALEQNSAWFYFEIDDTAPPDLVLGFIIHPNGGFGEDYDWALFGPDVDCGNLGFPIRCSSSDSNCGFCPDTGMGMGTTDFSEGPGTGDGFVSTLVVQPGQGFYLLVDNWLGTTNGFVLEWTDSAAPYLNCNADPPCALDALAGPDINACEGETSIQLSGNSVGEFGNETYSWSGTNGGTAFLDDPDSQNPTLDIPVGFTGIIVYTLVVTEAGCTGEDEMTVTVNGLPSVNINPAGPYCENDSPHNLTASPPGGIWGGAITGNSFNPMTLGPGIHTVTYTYTDNNGCTGTASLDIEVYEKPEVTIDPDPVILCDSDGSIELTATGTGGAGGYSFHWTSPTGMGDGETYDTEIEGIYAVTVTDANGCTGTHSTMVTYNPNPLVEIDIPGPICQSLDLFTLTANPTGGEFEGEFITPEGEIFPNMTPEGTFSVMYTYTDDNNCSGSDMLNVTIVPTPEATADNNGPLCEGQQIFLFGETNLSGPGIIYQWEGPGGYTSNQQNPTDATQGGIYTLQVIVNDCPSMLAATDVMLTDQPDAEASNDGPYCGGQSIQLFGNTNATGISITYQWTGPGGYTSTQQNPADATLPGTYSLIVTVDNCESAVVTTDVIFGTPPDATAANTGPYCAGDPIVLSGNTTTTGTTVNYSWTGPNGYTSSAQNPVDATTPGLYQLIINVDGCNSLPASTMVIINNVPAPVITGENSFCIGTSATIDAGSGYAQYMWSNGNTNQMQDVTASGIYSVTVTDANGCTGIASISVTETASLIPVISGLLEFCEGANTILDAGPGYTSYTWSTGENGQSIQVSSGGNFGVLVTNSDGCSGSANVTVVVHPNPLITIGGSTTYCIGGFTILDAGTGHNSYLWNTGATSQTITVSSPGIYSVDVVDVNGCQGSGSVMVDESTSLNPVITGNTAFCQQGSTTLNAGSGFATYLWSDGSMNSTLFVIAAGTYSVSVSDGQGCTGESSVAVTEVLPPSAILQAGTQLCNTSAGGSLINLYDLILSGDMNGSWEDVDQSGAVGLFTSLDFNGVIAGDYRFRYTTNSAVDPCPEAVYEVTITIIDCTCPDVFFLPANALCNESDVLDLATLENTSEAGTWSLLSTPPGSDPATLNGNLFNAASSDPGTYTLQFTLLSPPPPGCPADYQIQVIVDDQVTAGTSMMPLDFCEDENVMILLSDAIEGEDLNGTWTEVSAIPSQGSAFDPVNGIFDISGQVAATYTFEYSVVSGNACPGDVSEVTIVVNPLPVVIISSVASLDCSHPMQMIDATGSSFGPQYDITWSGPGIVQDGNENTLSPNIDEPGTYTLIVTNNLTGCFQSASVIVLENVASPSGAVMTIRNPSCFGDIDGSIVFEQIIDGTPPYLYSINGGAFDHDPALINLPAADYTVIVEDANGCRWDTMISLVQPSQIEIDLGPDIEIDLGNEGQVNATLNFPAGLMDTIIWSPSQIVECFDAICLEATVQTFNTISLNATVLDVYGCPASDDIVIRVLKERKIYIPTVFSPDGDGLNDVFFISGDERQMVGINQFAIYSRWGERIFEVFNILPNDPSKGWNGEFRHRLVNPGVFVYTAEIEYIDGLTEKVNGSITVMR